MPHVGDVRAGSLEATQATAAQPAAALKYSWDTKVTADLAMLGGLQSLLGPFLVRRSLREAFDERVAYDRWIKMGR